MWATTATAEERFDLITRRLQEVLGGDIIKTILAEGRSPKCYWGVLFVGLVITYLLAETYQGLHLLVNVRHHAKFTEWILQSLLWIIQLISVISSH